MKKILLALAAIAVLVLILFALAVLRLDTAVLGARAIEEINRKSGIQLQAERIALHPLKGLDLEDARASGTSPAGEFNARIDHLRIKHRLLPLLWGQVVMSEVLLERPEIELVSKPAERSRRDRRKDRKRGEREEAKKDPDQPALVAPAPDAHGSESLRLSVKSLKMNGGAFSARTTLDEEVDLSIDDLNLSLQDLEFDPQSENSPTAVSGRGTFSSSRIVHGDFVALRSSGEVELSSGIAMVTEVEVHSENSDLTIQELQIEVDRDPPRYRFSAVGGLDLNGVLQAGEGPRFGPVKIDLEAKGRGPELDAMTGEGTLRLDAGALPGFPAMVQIEELLGRTLLTGREYESATIDYELADNQLIIAPFELVGDGGKVGGEGEFDLAGTMDLDVYIRLPLETLDIGLVDSDQLASLEDDQGMVKIPFTIHGSFEDPKVGMEWDGLKELVQGSGRSWAERALEEAADKAREWLQEQGSSDNDED